ncbi:MAG: ABC transporter six-transmembrane domain-containing protein [Planctomycetota bacterium]
MAFSETDKLSLSSILRRYWMQVGVTWGLTFVETAVLAVMPLFIGWSIDGLLANDWNPFLSLIGLFVGILVVATARRVYDTRAYGTIRVAMGETQANRSDEKPVSVVNARILMGRELVDFLEFEAPMAMTSLVQVLASIGILLSFHYLLAGSAFGSVVLILLIYAAFSKLFFRLNSQLNEQSEQQIHALESRSPKEIAAHFLGLRRQEVRLSDTESLVYGIIFAVLLTMLGFNLWFSASQTGASAGNIFSIVTYSLEFLQSAVALPAALQSLTRLSEITERINQVEDESEDEASSD